MSIQTLHASTPISAGLIDLIDKAKGLSLKAKDQAKKEITEHIESVSRDLKVTREKIQMAFDEPRPMNMLKACGYSLATMHGAFAAAHRIADHGVMSALVHIAGHSAMHKIGHKIKNKAKGADEIIKKYPALKALTGPAIAGLMLYGYTTAQTSSLDHWDLSKVGKALQGKVSVEEFVQSSEAHALGTHIASGHGMSLASLAASSSTLAIALVATAVRHADHPKVKELGASIKSKLSKLLPETKASEQVTAPTNDAAKPAEGQPPKTEKPDAGTPDAKKHDNPDSPKKGNPGWWQRMTDSSKDQYLKRHPESQMASTVNQMIARSR